MRSPEGSQQIKVGVLLARQPDDLAQWLVDAAAFDAAGADALWVDLAPDPQLDPLAVIAALAAVTSRATLVAALPASAGTSAVPKRALATIARLSRGRLRIAGGADVPDGTGVGLEPVAAGDGAPPAGGYGVEAAGRWAPAPPPQGRAAWRTTLLEAAERGFDGVLVPADPRLIDILRNPDDPGQRLDLHLAHG